MQTAYIFNQLGRPDLTQYWSSEVTKRTFGGLSTSTGYNGDEDQGLMGSLAVLLKLGMFQLNGGTEHDPIYEFGSPLFNSVNVLLPNENILTIQKEGEGVYVKEVFLNGNKISALKLNHSTMIKGGILIFKMSQEPIINK